MTTDFKLCRDCRWINQWAQCENPAIPLLDLVNGNHHVFYCEVARRNEELCGLEARLFEGRL